MSDDSDSQTLFLTRQLPALRGFLPNGNRFAALRARAKNLSQLKWSSTTHCPFFVKGTRMKAFLNTSKVLLLVAALGVAFAGCERRGADQSSGSSGTSGMSGSSQSGSGSSGTPGSSGSSGSTGGGTSGTNK
ncbi:MAG: hypothetical protein ACM3WS_05935 [Bacillota bacterium]